MMVLPAVHSRRDISPAEAQMKTIQASEGDGIMASAGLSPNLAKAKTPEIKWSMKTDVVVLGAGGAGLLASIEAARAGAKVILLESTSRVGGSSAISGGSIVFAGTDFQKENGVHDSKELLYDDFMEIGGHRNVPELIQTYVNHQLETYYQLKKMGVAFKMIVLAEGSVPRSHKVNPAKLILILKKEAVRLGVETIMETPATRLVRNAKGRIIGVKANQGKKELTIGARRGVVICTGGFSNNPEILEDFKIGFSKVRSFAAPGHRGDGLKMLCMEGAFMKDLPSIKASYSTHPKSKPGKRQAVNTYRVGAILINKNGKRFVNEGLGHKELPEFTTKQPDGIVFELFDAKIAPEAATKAMRIKEQDLERWAMKGSTLEELAVKAEMSAETLKETVALYNESLESGKDLEYGREGLVGKVGKLIKIDTPPFYFVEGISAILGTYCGAKVNSRAQVLNVYGEPIPGLYAAGEVMGGLHGDGYMSGTALGKALIFGRLAGKNVAVKKG
jgi:fumarate reductase flavoprotein subunit